MAGALLACIRGVLRQLHQCMLPHRSVPLAVLGCSSRTQIQASTQAAPTVPVAPPSSPPLLRAQIGHITMHLQQNSAQANALRGGGGASSGSEEEGDDPGAAANILWSHDQGALPTEARESNGGRCQCDRMTKVRCLQGSKG